METILIILTLLSSAAAAGFAAAAWRARAEQQRRSAARVAALAASLAADDTPGSEALRPVHVASMFATTSAGGGRFARQVALTGVAAALVIIGGTIVRNDPRPAAAVRSEPALLELVSMRHVRSGRTLTVTGLVRNPRTGALVTRVTAVVFAFDRNGDFVGSARGPLEFKTLEPGGESPFSVTMTDLGEVGRYRVSFRTDERLLRHVDGRRKEA